MLLLTISPFDSRDVAELWTTGILCIDLWEILGLVGTKVLGMWCMGHENLV